MQLERVGLRGRPFHKKGRPAIFVHYRSQQKAFSFFKKILTDGRGIGLLRGPQSSGKSVLAKQFVHDLHTDIAVAVVDGAQQDSTQLLSRILAEFGYDVASSSTDELLNVLNVFVVQQTRTSQAPLLILKNIHDMHPDALCVLCKLASLVVHNRFALRIILLSDRDIRHIMESPSMSHIAQRMTGDFDLEPMSAKETQVYLYAKLLSCGATRPDDVFSFEVCDKLHRASGGWPGKLDSIAMSAIEQAEDLPIRSNEIDCPEPGKDDNRPQLMVTLNGRTVQEFKLVTTRALIGCSILSDIIIDDQFVSAQHALLIRDHGRVILADLKSANGTFVNSRKIATTVLANNDIISLGDHRIKVIFANILAPEDIDDPNLADTARMKIIDDSRRAEIKSEGALVAIRGNG